MEKSSVYEMEYLENAEHKPNREILMNFGNLFPSVVTAHQTHRQGTSNPFGNIFQSYHRWQHLLGWFENNQFGHVC